MSYDPQSGNVGLVIDSIGPGDEGEYTCCARNEFGEAICAVFIQPECVNVPLYQQRMQQMQQHRSEKTAYSNGSQSIVSEVSNVTIVTSLQNRLMPGERGGGGCHKVSLNLV